MAVELRSWCFWQGVLVEAVATLIFVGVVLGASVDPRPLAPALAAGLVAGALACTLRAPQANPALTLALLCTRKLSALRGAAGLLAQCTGAVLASAIARLALPDDTSLVTRVSGPPGWAGSGQRCGCRCPGCGKDPHSPPRGCWSPAGTDPPVPQGPFSGGSMNPARSLGPAITPVWGWVPPAAVWDPCDPTPTSPGQGSLALPLIWMSPLMGQVTPGSIPSLGPPGP
uniref:Aquaporin 14 n=1 Tax=Falco tinnunculus TaxID=100819 RepID=A0A8C4UEI3_FALTI